MEDERPHVIILGGPNGAGKSTAAPALLRGTLRVAEFVNMDVIAQGLSAFEPDRVGLTAGRIMLARLQELARQRADFAFETTLASRSFAGWIEHLKCEGYSFHLLFLWLSTTDCAIQRVADRVRMGGHGVPDEIVKRRYRRGLVNFFELYQPLATTWRMYDNSRTAGPKLLAAGQGASATFLADERLWARLKRGLRDAC